MAVHQAAWRWATRSKQKDGFGPTPQDVSHSLVRTIQLSFMKLYPNKDAINKPANAINRVERYRGGAGAHQNHLT